MTLDPMEGEQTWPTDDDWKEAEGWLKVEGVECEREIEA